MLLKGRGRMKYKAIAFDWDGTLVNSVSHIVQSMKYAAEKMAFDLLPDANIRNIIGLGMGEAIRTLYSDISDADIDVFKMHYKKAFFATEVGPKQLFPGVNNLLKGLSEDGVRLAVATGKSRNGLDIALQTTGLKSYFDVERCADETKSKPHPLMLFQIMSVLNVKPDELLMVGDTDFDMHMAQRAGVDRIGVSFGAQPGSRLEKYKPLEIVDSLDELRALLVV